MKKIGVLRYSILLLSLYGVNSILPVKGQESLKTAPVFLTGRVLDQESRKPIRDATIRTSVGKQVVRSDEQGYFRIDAQGSSAVRVRVSSVGYEEKEISIDAATGIVELSPLTSSLDEVVVVGYGTQRRRDLTGSVASVSKQHLEYNTAPSVDALLGGAIAGVNVTQASGQPGAPATIRIRGGNSVNASNNPLYVIDGFIFFSDNASTKTGFGGIEGEMNPLNLLNPADIESIEVLKDVSATAIYGARGSNGVILITTKKGDRGKDGINYQYTVGTSESAKKLNLLNATQWARLQKDYFLNKPGYSDAEIASLGAGHDWQDAVLRTGITQNHSLSLNGGDDKSTYFISANNLKQEGVVLNSDFNRFVGRINYTRQLFPNLDVGLSVTGNKSNQSSLTTFEAVNYNSSPYSAGITNSLVYALYMPPVLPFYTEDGDYNYNNPFEYAYLRQGTKTANPISDLENSTARSIYSTVLGNFYAQYRPFDGFTAKLSVGSNLAHATQKYFSPSYTALGLEPKGIGGIGNKNTQLLLSELTLAYAGQFHTIHRFDALIGGTVQSTKNDFVSTLSAGFTNEDLGVDNLQDGSPYGSRPIWSGATESKLYSFLGRVNYSLLDRYHLTGNFRSDYSTRFAKNHKWGIFPSLGAAWNITDEPFFTQKNVVSNLKLRVSGGSVGNQEIGDYEYLQILEAVHYGGDVAYRVGNNGNEDLKWETTRQYNIGTDVGLFNNRINVVIDAYTKKTSDLLLLIPPSLGQEDEQLTNVGNLTNRGLEFSVNTVAIQSNDLQWTISGNIARNSNKITQLYNNETQKVLSPEILQVGKPLGSFYGLIFEGIVQSGDNVSALPTSPSYTTVEPGDPKFKDIDGDGHIGQADRAVLGSKQPNWTYGLSSLVNYKGFDFFFLFQGSQGNSIYNQLRRYLEKPNDAYNASAALLNAWTTENPSNTVPRITTTPFSSELDSRYIEDASYLRLKTLTLGYTFGKGSFNRSHLRYRIRVFATGQNLLTVTSYKGYDPEIASGIDLGAYPMPRTFFAGASISF